MIDAKRRTVIAFFDGSLGSSYLLAQLADLGHRVHAAVLDAGSFGGPDEGLAETARALGAVKVVSEDLRGSVYQQSLRGVLRFARPGDELPALWRAAEARAVAGRLGALARQESDGAVGLLLSDGDLDLALSDQDLERVELEAPDEDAQRARLRDKDLPCPAAEEAEHRVQERLWGTVIAGGELDDPWEDLSPDLYPNLAAPEEVGDLPEEFIVELESGLPVGVFGNRLDGVSLFEQLSRVGRRQGVGRRLALGPEQRWAWEAPAFEVLLTARRALERACLDPERLAVLERLGREWLDHARSGDWSAPLLGDVTAFAESAHAGLSGQVLLRLSHGHTTPVGVRPAK